MKPPQFEYYRPDTVAQALDLLAALGPDAKVLAGGQSLVPLMNFRLASPKVLVDIHRLAELQYIREEDGWLVIGAGVTQAEVERSALAQRLCPLLTEALQHVGHAAIRSRGTLAGSLVHADPAAEVPTVFAAMGGEAVIRSRDGERRARPEGLFLTYYTTTVGPDELVTEVRLPAFPARLRTGTAFVEVARRTGDFALAGVAVAIGLDEKSTCQWAAIGVGGTGPFPMKAQAAEGALLGRDPVGEALSDAVAAVRLAVSPDSDIHASAEYRRHLVGVLLERALRDAARRAGEGGS